MKKILLILAIIMMSIALKSQTITDSTYVVVAVSGDSEDVFLSQTTGSFCTLFFEKKIHNGIMLIVSGIKKCEDYYKKEQTFLKVIFKEKDYFIDPKNVIFLKNEQTNFIEEISQFSDKQKNDFYNHAKEMSEVLDGTYLKNIATALNKTKEKGLCVLSHSIYDESEYTDGTGFEIDVYNSSKKTIKYITFNVIGYNPVGDTVMQKGKSIVSLKGVGPIKPEDTGSYKFDYAWMTDLVHTHKVSSIVLQYMDGTSKTLQNIDTIKLRPDFYFYMSS